MHRQERRWDEYIAAGGESPYGDVVDDLAPYGPAWQAEQQERGGW